MFDFDNLSEAELQRAKRFSDNPQFVCLGVFPIDEELVKFARETMGEDPLKEITTPRDEPEG